MTANCGSWTAAAHTPSATGEITMASNLETAKKAYELFQRGDIPTLIKDIIDESAFGEHRSFPIPLI